MKKQSLLSDAGRRVAQALLAACAAPDFPLPGLGMRLEDIQALAPGVAEEFGLNASTLAAIDPATRARLLSLLAGKILD
jgi:hypothetical protein